MSAAPFCVANIGSRGRRARLVLGLACLAGGLTLLVGGLAAGAHWRLVGVFLTFLVGTLGVLQARGHT